MSLHQNDSGAFLVAGVKPGGPADVAGCIHEGDVLLRVDEHILTPETSMDLVKTRIIGPPGSPIRFVFQREQSDSAVVRQSPEFYQLSGQYVVTVKRSHPPKKTMLY